MISLHDDQIADLSEYSDQEAQVLCQSLRKRILDIVSRNGGHLSSNLGAVELTVAIHRVFHTGRDRLVFDVGHQCYAHKLLTGRGAAMETLRTLDGIAGFPKPGESVHDAFVAGHASNSVSVAVGMARARSLRGEDYSVLALIGDGALSGGLSYEGLSDAGGSGEPLIVILNDNGMSITKSVGGVADYLAHQRLKPQYLRFKHGYQRVMQATAVGRGLYRLNHRVKTAIKESLLPCSLFENMGFTYLGPVDGHDVKGLTRLLRYAKELKTPVLLHVRTVKGKGYPPAEQNPDRFHGVGPFLLESGAPLKAGGETFSTRLGRELCSMAERDPKLCAVTAAMCSGTGLSQFAQQFPERFFDVGIAEEHAVTMCAGMAKQGITPVFAVYSTFLQRSYDMLIHDAALQGLHVVLAVDRAGLVGEDGETHHGIYDPAYLRTVPGMKIFCPASFSELQTMLFQAVYETEGPAALRYPRGGEGAYRDDHGKTAATVLAPGRDLTIVTYGTLINEALEARELLSAQGISAEIVKLNVIVPLEPDVVFASLRKTGRLLMAEECAADGCIGEVIAAEILNSKITLQSFKLCNLGHTFVQHGPVGELKKRCGIDGESLARAAREVMGDGKETTGYGPV